MDFRKMNLIELGEFWLKDWEKDSPKLEDPNNMRNWENAVEAAKRAASELELLELLHMFKEEDYIETIWNIKKHLTLRFTEMLEEKVRQIEKSVQVLLKEHDLEQANITIGQLNRLKGGI
jgi:hypothetical protein